MFDRLVHVQALEGDLVFASKRSGAVFLVVTHFLGETDSTFDIDQYYKETGLSRSDFTEGIMVHEDSELIIYLMEA